MSCKHCIYFVLSEIEKTDRDAGRAGRCRRHSPNINGFPVVFENEWCGDNKFDENKV
jgi:hypothetical protein